MDVELTDFSSTGHVIDDNHEEKEDDTIARIPPELLFMEDIATEKNIPLPSRLSRLRERMASVSHRMTYASRMSSANVDVSMEALQKQVAKYLQIVGRQKDTILRREQRLIKAAFGEFMSALVFYTTVFAYRVNVTAKNIPFSQAALSSSMVNGFLALALSYAFSQVSGSQINPALSFALYVTGKSTLRKFLTYFVVQMFASIMGVLICFCMFTENENYDIADSIMKLPVDPNNVSAFFFSEFYMTATMIYMAFTVAFEDADSEKLRVLSLQLISDSKGLSVYSTTPQSRIGFAPFAIGFANFSMNMVGGNSNNCFNPARIFGPAIFCGKWKYVYYYWIAEFSGAALAGLLVHYTHSYGLRIFGVGMDKRDLKILGDMEQRPTAIHEASAIIAAHEEKHGPMAPLELGQNEDIRSSAATDKSGIIWRFTRFYRASSVTNTATAANVTATGQ